MEQKSDLKIRSKSSVLKKRIKKQALEWICSSTSHGLPNIFRTDQMYLKIFWLVLFIISSVMCFVLTAATVVLYFKYETNINIALNVEVPTKFPSVTICCLNPFYPQRGKKILKSASVQQNISGLLESIKTNGSARAIDVTKQMMYGIKNIIASIENLTDFQREQLGFTLSDMLISCSFNNQPCYESDFVYLSSYDYTNCYTFNSGRTSNGSKVDILEINSAGPGSSLEIELFVGDPQKDEYFVYKSGAYVVVHNQSVTPLLDTEGVEVSAGFQNNLAIRRTYVNNLPYPYSNCLKDVKAKDAYDSKLYKAIFSFLNQSVYRQKFCFKMCYQYQVIQECNCYDSRLPNPMPLMNNTITKRCIIPKEVDCMITQKSIFQSSPISDLCETQCPKECEFIYYDLVSSESSYPTDFYKNFLEVQQNVRERFGNNTDGLARGMLKLNVFYNAIDYTSITQSPSLTWQSVIGTVGGNVGLFIGISLLSLAELLEIFMEIIRICWTHYSGRNKTDEVRSKYDEENNF